MSSFNAFSSRFVEIVSETMTSHVRHLGHARVHVLVSCSPFFGTNAARAWSFRIFPYLVARRGAKSNALSRDIAAVNYSHPTSNERKVGVIVCEGVHKVVQGALPLYVTPSLENSLVRLVSRWKTGSQRGERYSDATSWSNGATVIRGTSLRPLGAFAPGKHAPSDQGLFLWSYTGQRRRSPALLHVEHTMSGPLRRWR